MSTLHCVVWYDIPTVGGLMSMLMETHIAAGFVGIYWRWIGLIEVLRVSLRWTWLVVPVICVNLAVRRFRDDIVDLNCGLTRADGKEVLLVGLTVFTVTLCCYVCASFRATWYPGHEERRAQVRMWLYPINFFLTVGPTVFQGHYYGSEANSSQIFTFVVSLPMSLNGFLNCLAYFWSLRDGLDARLMSTRYRRSATWRGIVCPTGFVIDHEEVDVACVQRMAMTLSEEETLQVEQNKEPDTGSFSGSQESPNESRIG
eukprot:CAMPEP_0194528456 /NCGR_PEP_ID=MMETSP0253-20130528/64859_1 /TAXON_ID=2966 /ORGANISM="Noctiluca scintillans" /LENGTH=257 /DNA_ID=CAMNT_0039373505 /DNA_START=1 /DNA_END=771 /DNA_ORIENTATION=-